jgi:hemolysin D
LQSLVAHQRMLAVRMRRIQAELDGLDFVSRPADGPDGPMQLTLFRESQAQLQSHLTALDEQIQQDQEEQRSVGANVPLLSKQLAVAENVASIRADLYEKQVGSKLQMLDSLSSKFSSQRALQDAIHRVQELQHEIQGKQADRQSTIDGWRHDLMEASVRDRAEADATQEQIIKAQHLSDLVTITAPQDGVVLAVADRSAGSVMREAEPLVTLMPEGVPLIADVMIDSADIGYAKPGAEVSVKVTAFSFNAHGMLKGKLRSISQETYPVNGAGSASNSGKGLNEGPAYHKAQIVLVNSTLHNLPPGAKLLPGMTISADIKVGSRRLISYFLTPVIQGFDESFREPG